MAMSASCGQALNQTKCTRSFQALLTRKASWEGGFGFSMLFWDGSELFNHALGIAITGKYGVMDSGD